MRSFRRPRRHLLAPLGPRVRGVRPASLLSLALALAACGPAPAPAPPPGSARLRIATWNVHDLFDERDDPLTEDPVPRPATVERKLARLAAVLARLDADVLVLQEVENLALLERLAGAAGPLGYGHLHLLEGRDPRGIDVAVLSRLPFTRRVSHLSDRDAGGALLFSRDLAEVHLAVAGREVVVLGAHFASKREPQDALRLSQARRADEVARGLLRDLPGALVVVAGDLNDEPGSAPLRPLLEDPLLADLGATLPPDVAYTYVPIRYRGRLDYLLAGGEALAWLERVEVLGGEDVESASDHRPVLAEVLVLPP